MKFQDYTKSGEWKDEGDTLLPEPFKFFIRGLLGGFFVVLFMYPLQLIIVHSEYLQKHMVVIWIVFGAFFACAYFYFAGFKQNGIFSLFMGKYEESARTPNKRKVYKPIEL